VRTITGNLFTIDFEFGYFLHGSPAEHDQDWYGLPAIAYGGSSIPIQIDVEFYFVAGFESAAGWAAGSRKEGLRDAVKSYDFPRSVSPVTKSS